MEKDATRICNCIQKLGSKKINTTLYDLVEAVMEEAEAGESRLVTLVVLRLLGKARPLETIYH